jgi:hypothetical protein
MTKISNQYSLTNVLFADTTNGRVGVNNTSPTVALDVTGAGKFSSSLTASGLSSPEKTSAIFGINAATSSGNGGSLTVKAGNGSGSGNTSGSLNLAFGRGGAGAASGSMNFGVAQATDDVGLDATYMTITSSGNVGISNTSPNTAYDAGSWFTAKGLTIGNTSSVAGLQIVSSTTSTLSSIRFGDGSDGLYDQGFIGYIHNTDRLVLGANRNTSLSITSSNNILIGTSTDNGYKLNVSGSIYSSSSIVSNGSMYAVGGIGSQGNVVTDYGYGFGLNSNTQNAGNAWNFYVSSSFSNNFRFFYGGTGVGSGSAKFQIDTGGGYTGLSDINKKKDIASSALGLAEVMQLKPSTFKFKDDENQEEQIGFIAQEVKNIIPQAYYEDKEGDDKFIGLKQAAFIPVLVKAIQEQQTQINELKALINA